MFSSSSTKRSSDSDNMRPVNSKRTKYDTTAETYQCEYCAKAFANSANLRQHVDSFHMQTASWECSECKKMFTTKSNLKVHLRVHTRIKPYHCKSCTYSCMHHSSIKEHLARIHPGIIHSTTNPAYVFNSTAVPDPDQFNSKSFDHASFIATAREANDKLIAKISNNNSFNLSHASTSSSLSPQSNYSDIKQEDASFINEHSQSLSSNESLFESSAIIEPPTSRKTGKKFTSFNIRSLLSDSHVELESKPQVSTDASLNAASTYLQQWVYANQIQLYYNYMLQLQHNKN